jgi:hypothetical protein
MAFAKPWLIQIVRNRLVEKRILDPTFFLEEFLEYSSVWIDSNSSWLEAGCKRPTALCGRQGVIPNFSFRV